MRRGFTPKFELRCLVEDLKAVVDGDLYLDPWLDLYARLAVDKPRIGP
jgi:hypothetical protein